MHWYSWGYLKAYTLVRLNIVAMLRTRVASFLVRVVLWVLPRLRPRRILRLGVRVVRLLLNRLV